MLGIEVPVLQVGEKRWGACKDLVVWREGNSTPFRGCDPSVSRLMDLRESGCKPFAVMEWKHVSRFTKYPTKVLAEHANGITSWLKENLRGGMLSVGYAILIDHSNQLTLRCRRLTANSEDDCWLALPTNVGS